MKKFASLVLVAVVMFAGMLPLGAITAFAEDGVEYLDANGNVQTANGVTEITDGGEYPAGWYILYGEKSMGRITFTGTAYLILADKANITVTDSVIINEGISITICSQSLGERMGRLTVNGSHFNAGIGSCEREYCGNITINGGIVTATGTDTGAGIGSGRGGECGDITINGGIVTAYAKSGGAGIGTGGPYAYSSGGLRFSACGDITINGGTVTAYGGDGGDWIGSGAGIGNGQGQAVCGYITINGGTVTAIGGNYCAGIGSGSVGTGQRGEGLSYRNICSGVIINGGTVTAVGDPGAAGIGSGVALKSSGDDSTISACGKVIINGGKVEASTIGEGPGIGASDWGECHGVEINGGHIRANAKFKSADKEAIKVTAPSKPVYAETCSFATVDGWLCVNCIEEFDETAPTCTESGHHYYMADYWSGLYYSALTFKDNALIGDKAALAVWLGEGGGGFTGAPLGHLDDNEDGICDSCGGSFYYDYDTSLKQMLLKMVLPENISVIDASADTIDLTDGWYIVRGSIDVPGGIAVNGDVQLIIADNSTLSVKKGIRLAEGKTLTIYSHSFGGSMGAIIVTDVADNCAGIGSGPDSDCEGITINGGNITVTGGMGGAAIGSGAGTDCKNVTINGGRVIVNDGKGGNGALKAGKGGAGIGSGVGGNCICVTINGGYVEARGGKQLDGDPNGGAGIGGGSYGNGGDVYVNGGTVRVYGYNNKTPSFGKPIYEMGSAAVLHVGEGVNAYTLNALEEKDAKLKDDASGIVETYTYYRIIIDSETSNDNDDPVNPYNPGEHIHLGILQPGVAATEKSAGYKDCYECSCGKFFEDVACTVEITDIDAWKAEGGNGYIAPLSGEQDTPTSPQTGDTSNMTLWIMLMLVSAMGLCACLIFGKRKRTVK